MNLSNIKYVTYVDEATEGYDCIYCKIHDKGFAFGDEKYYEFICLHCIAKIAILLKECEKAYHRYATQSK